MWIKIWFTTAFLTFKRKIRTLKNFPSSDWASAVVFRDKQKKINIWKKIGEFSRACCGQFLRFPKQKFHFQNHRDLLPRKLSWNLKITHSKRKKSLKKSSSKPPFLGFKKAVNFPGVSKIKKFQKIFQKWASRSPQPKMSKVGSRVWFSGGSMVIPTEPRSKKTRPVPLVSMEKSWVG